MAVKIYCDTNIFLDYLLDRKSFAGRSLGDAAFGVFNRTLSCEFEIIFSSWNAVELKNKVDTERLQTLFSFLKRKITTITHTENDVQIAKSRSEHFQDALHAILANKGGATMLITRNLLDYQAHRDLIQPKLPEAL